MTGESRIVANGTTVRVRWTRRPRGYSAELYFDDDDRAVLDAGSLDELQQLVQTAASAAVIARKCADGDRRGVLPA